MEIGALRQRLVLENPTVIRDSFGEGREEYVAAGKVWGQVEPLTGRELFAAQQLHAETSLRITLRYQKGVTPHSRLRLGERIFHILSVAETNLAHRQLVVLCKEESHG